MNIGDPIKKPKAPKEPKWKWTGINNKRYAELQKIKRNDNNTNSNPMNRQNTPRIRSIRDKTPPKSGQIRGKTLPKSGQIRPQNQVKLGAKHLQNQVKLGAKQLQNQVKLGAKHPQNQVKLDYFLLNFWILKIVTYIFDK